MRRAGIRSCRQCGNERGGIGSTGAIAGALVISIGMFVVGIGAIMGVQQASAGTCAPANAAAASGVGSTSDGTPTLMGPSTLTAEQVLAWWNGGHHSPHTAEPMDKVIGYYIDEGNRQGVRGDLAFAQAVLETGYFTNGDTTSRNNYAGIRHYDHVSSGQGFSSPQLGVRAQIQLLKKYALGNNSITLFANDPSYKDESPNTPAHATTVGELATKWATDPSYATPIMDIFNSMLKSAGLGVAANGGAGATAGCTPSTSGPSGYALPLDRALWDKDSTAWLAPVTDHAAADIPAAEGTQVNAISGGTVTSSPVGGVCGLGVEIKSSDGVTWRYCHGTDGGQMVHINDVVAAGQPIMHSGNTGNSTGAHLQVEIVADGTYRCPGTLFTAIANAQPADVRALPTTGCYSAPASATAPSKVA